MLCQYSEALVTRPEVSFITYTTSSDEQTGNIITLAQFKEGNLAENERNVAEDESILSLINESSTDNDSDNRSIGMNNIEDIWYGNYVHSYIIERDARLKINYRIK